MTKERHYDLLKPYKRLFSPFAIGLLSMMICLGPQLGRANNEGVKIDIFQSSITGTVTDETGAPLPGANIVEKGTLNGVTTDFDGNYSINISGPNAILVASYIGYATMEVLVNEQNKINFNLELSASNLDEVVVTALGIERSRKSLAYSVTEVDGSDFTEARETNVANSLSGKVAGVNVTNTASGPAGSTRVIIRGSTSLTGDNQPLYVVDGVPMDNSNQGSAGTWGGNDQGDGIGNINPDDIETMTVLKGNTAAALYGNRASNGVILITTKSAKANQKLKVEFNTNFVTDGVLDYLDVQREYGGGLKGQKPADQMEAGGSGGGYTWGGKLDGTPTMQFDGVKRPYSYAGDNVSRFYRTGYTFTNTLAFSGGTENFGFRFSASDLKNQSIIPNSGMGRDNFTFNVNGKIGDKFTMQASSQYIIEKVKNVPRISDSPGNANYFVIQLPNNLNVENLRGDPNKLGADPNTGMEYLPSSSVWFQNPYWAAYQYYDNHERNRLIGSLTLTYDFTDWLYLTGRAGTDQWNRFHEESVPYGTSFDTRGSLSQDMKKSVETNYDLMLGSAKVFDNGFGYNLLLGANRMRREIKSNATSGSDFALPFFNSYGNTLSRAGDISYMAEGTNSVYGQAEVSFKSYVYLTGTARTDWFSTLNAKSITYPSLSLSTVLSSIFNMPSYVDFLKLRGAWAQVGGATSPYNLNQTYSLDQPHLGVAVGGIAQGIVLNSNLTPLTATEVEVGIDGQFFNNRLGLDFTLYDRKTEDDILNATISETSGYSGAVVNVGKVTNKGVELLLRGTPIRTNNFSWDVSLNFAYNKSEVVSLLNPDVNDESLQVGQSRSLNAWVEQVEGLPYGQITGFKYLRDTSGNIVINSDGLPQQDVELGVVPFGSGVHPLTGGLTNRFRYKSFDLGFLIDVKNGAVMHSGTNSQLYLRGLHKNTLIGRENGIGSIPASDLRTYYTHIANNITEQFIYDASYVKFRQLDIGYNISPKIASQIGASSLRIAFVGRNLWLIHSNVPNVDPESNFSIDNAQGLEFVSMPPARTLGFNLRAIF